MKDPLQSEENSKKEKKKKKKKKEASRSAETMFRTTLTNHIELSSMADQKAGLMISVNSVVVSIMVSFMVNELADNPRLILPTCLLVVVSLLTITFSILATKPSVKSVPKAEGQRIDLLFFGDYTLLSLDEYNNAMTKMLESENTLRNQMIASIYAQGAVLSRKYKLLKIAYTIFMFGFPLVVLVYFLALSGLF
ncbi:MAG: metal-dependent phosphohydrolase [Runella slithyformis]|nr:MAG: metal-dependent phosphohydrolase [Runella slithyformis]TAF45295.1 MAG: metal-dependent phosphohydrolase [Runella slithyformis]TAG50931.1 MAG: metal-dependent phosphohydrolase [Runella slithyformis]TAG67937.1 MAG: metal-dependent phosphohydrolase [Runella slithyformis]